MKLGELFVQLTTKGDTKELDKTLKQLESAHKQNVIDIRTKKELAKATTEEEKALIKKNTEVEKGIAKTKQSKEEQQAHNAAIKSAVMGFTAFVAGATIAYNAINRMINALADANQKIISFNRQTGISIGTLNKYASASAAVNRNATIEGTSQSLQNVASNLFDIQMGRGDISPYQELAFVGGKAFNPANMSVEQVIENVRDAIKGVGDIQATNIITRMGFSPEDLQMLRMSREEFQKIQGLFLDPASREALNKYGLQLKIVSLQFQLLKDKALLKIMPLFIGLSRHLLRITTLWATFVSKIAEAVQNTLALRQAFVALAAVIIVLTAAMHPMLALFTAIYLIIEDLAAYFLGWKSVTGIVIENIGKLGDAVKNARLENLNKIFEGFDEKGFIGKWKAFAEGLSTITWPEWFKTFLTNPMVLMMNLNKVSELEPSPINTNNQTMNDNRVASAEQNNVFNIYGDRNIEQQVYGGMSRANLQFNTVTAQNPITA